MDSFSQFRTKTFTEQFQMLQEAEKEKDRSIIPHLFDLINKPLGDEVMDSMVHETTKKLLVLDEDQVCEGLESDCVQLQKICIQVAGDNQFPKAGESLRQLALKGGSLLLDMLTACAKYSDETMLPVFQAYLDHPDPLVASLCIGNVGRLKDHTSLPFLINSIESFDHSENLEHSEIIAAETIQALSDMGLDECFLQLSKCVHHPHPVLRRLVHEGLKKGGDLSVPFLEAKFIEGDYDEKIMVANLLGDMPSEASSNALVRAVDSEKMDFHPYVRHAIYEAFGYIHSHDGVQLLLKGLEEEETLLLLGVIHSLDNQVNPNILMHIRKLLREDYDRYKILLEAIVTARALNLFKMLYKDRNLQESLLDYLERSEDPFLMAEFTEFVPQIPKERFLPFINAKKEHCILVVDDSPSSLRYMRSILTDDRTEVVTAEDGVDALTLLEKGKTVHLVLTDMNMPRMNGVELTLKLKKHLLFSQLKIIMVTTESDESQKNFARHAGVDGFLTKPFKPDELKAKVDSFLGK